MSHDRGVVTPRVGVMTGNPGAKYALFPRAVPIEDRFHFCHIDTSSMYYTIAIEPTVCEEVAAAIMLDLTILDLLLDGETAIGMKWRRGKTPNPATHDAVI